LIKTKRELKLSEVKNFGLQAEMRKLEADLIIPGFTRDQKLVIVLSLGTRQSGKGFARTDVVFMIKYACKMADIIRGD